MTKQKPKYRPRIGDELWSVEWVYELAFYDDNADGDIDRDNCKEKTRLFKTKEEAVAFAEKVWPETHDKFGIVHLEHIRFMPYDDADATRWPHVGFWEGIDDGQDAVFSGEWER